MLVVVDGTTVVVVLVVVLELVVVVEVVVVVVVPLSPNSVTNSYVPLPHSGVFPRPNCCG